MLLRGSFGGNPHMTERVRGIIPVMLTPFLESGGIDYAGLERLIEWYLANGSDALFAVCQSSEMQFLSLSEREALGRFVVSKTAGRVPVAISGHVSETLDDQIAELRAAARTGAAAVVLVTNRLDPRQEGTPAFRHTLNALLRSLPADLPLGLYECPAPYRRLLSDEELRLCIDTGRFVLLKDVSCNLSTVRRRVALVRGSSFAVVNANAAIAFDAMKSGSDGFCGVFTNFHPDLYKWLSVSADTDQALAEELATFLVLAAVSENLGYPALAKLYHRRLGTFGSIKCRAIEYDILDRFWALDEVLDKIVAGTEAMRQKVRASVSPEEIEVFKLRTHNQ
jgi:4-hydroxy-tetrahydrodipicolinate synthase